MDRHTSFGLLLLPLAFSPLPAAEAAAQQPPGAADPDRPASSAYLDERARVLLEGVRASRQRLDSAIAGYTTTVTERISVGFRAFWRERLLFRREVAMRLSWRRSGPSRVEVLGARSVAPVASTEVEVPNDRELARAAGDLLFQPGRDRLLIGLDEGDALRHPLAEDAEVDYRYESGDTVRVSLPGGRTIRLVELRVHPRRDDFDLIAGSFWLDAESHALVRAVYRPARPFELVRDLARLEAAEEEREARRAEEAVRDGEERAGAERREGGADEEADDDRDDADGVGWIPGFLRPIRAEVRHIAVEYGLWQMRWWLPRIATVEFRGSAGRALGVPFRYERAYSAYSVEPVVAAEDSTAAGIDPDPAAADPTDAAGDPGADAGAEADPCAEWEDDEDRRGSFVAVAADSVRPASLGDLPEGALWGCRCPEDSPCEPYVVGPLAEADSLRASALLLGSVYADEDGALITEAELEAFSRLVETLPRTEDRWTTPRLAWTWGLGGPGLVRYNRVEGLSLGARVEADLGRARADLTARLGTADREPNGEFGLESAYYVPGVRLAAYRRLESANHGRGALGLGNSFFAAAFGLDDGDYYRALGVELAPASSSLPASVDGRLFAERQAAVSANTDASLRRVFDEAHRFRPNFAAAPADQLGFELRLRHDRGLAPHGWRGGAHAEMMGSTGTFDFGRGALGGWLTVPLPFRLVGALEAEAGASLGRPPPQRRWRLGGSA
ncbi:MAG: hypothetical protein ACODAE_00335, partial [Gemmatimonadota bacterium]